MLSLSYNFKFTQSIQPGLVTIANSTLKKQSIYFIDFSWWEVPQFDLCHRWRQSFLSHSPWKNTWREKRGHNICQHQQEYHRDGEWKVRPFKTKWCSYSFRAKYSDSIWFFLKLIFLNVDFWQKDVINNSDLFYKDVQDGISSIHFGVCNNKPLVYIGGNCAIQVSTKTLEILAFF